MLDFLLVLVWAPCLLRRCLCCGSCMSRMVMYRSSSAADNEDCVAKDIVVRCQGMESSEVFPE